MSLPFILRQIAQKSTHPNALVHKIQLARAKNQLLLAGQLGDGKEDVFALEAPEDEGRQGTEQVTQSSKGLEVESEAVRDDQVEKTIGGREEGGSGGGGDIKGEGA